MALNKPAAYGLYPQDVALREVIGILSQAGFEKEDMCVMLSPTHPVATVVRDAGILSAERDSTCATAGLIGWLSKLGAVVIPTIGFFVHSQAFFHALIAGMDSPALCATSSTLVALGFHEFEAERFEDQLHHCGALIYVSCRESAKTNWAVELLQRTGAREAATLEREVVAAYAETAFGRNDKAGRSQVSLSGDYSQ